MIILFTGANGAGKTLSAVKYIHDEMKKSAYQADPRPIYTNITDFQLGEPLLVDDPHDWREYPDSSIIIYDEAQQIFPQRSNSKPVPEHIADLSLHRKRGFDIIFITQYPTMIDHYIRQLVTSHYHLVRKSGLKFSLQYKADIVFDVSHQNLKTDKTLEKTVFKYPKELFDYYQSAQINNYTSRLSNRNKVLIAVFILLPIIMYIVGRNLFGMFQDKYYEQPAIIESPKPKPVSNTIDSNPANNDFYHIKLLEQITEKNLFTLTNHKLTYSDKLQVTKDELLVDIYDKYKPNYCVKNDEKNTCKCVSNGQKIPITKDICILMTDQFFDLTIAHRQGGEEGQDTVEKTSKNNVFKGLKL